MMLVVAALALMVAPGAAQPAAGTVAAADMNGYGRLVFRFARTIQARARVSSGIVIVSFDEPVRVDVEKLAAQLPAYVGAARADPDGRGVRFAIPRPLRVNLQEAGETVFVDLLPESWQGLPPGLPQEVVEELARRAREAEAQLRRQTAERARRQPRDLGATVASAPGFARLVLDPGVRVLTEIEANGEQVTVRFDAPLRFQPGRLRGRLPDTVTRFEAEQLQGQLVVTLATRAGVAPRAFREDDQVTIDIPTGAAPKSTGAPGVAEAGPAATPTPAAPAANPPPSPGPARPAPASTSPPAAAPLAPLRSPGEARAVPQARAALTSTEGGVSLRVQGLPDVAAAAFLRHDVAWLVLDHPIGVSAPDLRGQDIVRGVTMDRMGPSQILRLQLDRPRAIALVPDAEGWMLAIDGPRPTATEPVLLRRAMTERGQTVLGARFSRIGRVVWIDDPDSGGRMAVVTAHGPAQGAPKRQVFVDLSLLPSAHGLAIEARADDLQVTAGYEDLTVSRPGGLQLSIGVDRPADETSDTTGALDPVAWQMARRGDVFVRMQDLLRAVGDAPVRERNEARARLAFHLLANHLAAEALAVLRVLADDDAAAAATKPMLIKRLMAAAMGGAHGEAAGLLAEPALRMDPEAQLWRSYLEVAQGRHAQALIGYRQGAAVLERYPDDLQRRLRWGVVEAALANNEPGLAQQELAVLERLLDGPQDQPRIELLRGRIAQAQGREQEAFRAFTLARETTHEPTAVAARLERALLGHTLKAIPEDEALAELETVAYIWRRGEVEVRALERLARIYADRGRWREAFGAARRATDIQPEHPAARALHDQMAEVFEGLFLDGKADSLDRVEALGLFYDFRQFLPVSRRGDEIVRRLADRLADLGLVDRATELLEHQLRERLSGVARASVAARLAVLHLENRRPDEALKALRESAQQNKPEMLARGRLLIEARALADLARTDLALEILATLDGADVERIRADILWRARRWRESAEAVERLMGDRWSRPEPLEDGERQLILRAAVGHALADERIGLDRLRGKFGTLMAEGPDAQAFALATMESLRRPSAFRALARKVVATDSFTAFLATLRERHADLAGPPRTEAQRDDATQANPPPPLDTRAAAGTRNPG